MAAAAGGMAKNVKLQVVLVFFLIVISVVLFVFLAGKPNYDKIKEKVVKLTKLQGDLALKRGLEANKNNLVKEIAQLETLFKDALKSLPDDKEIPRLISQINENMNKSGLDFIRFRPTAIRPKDFYSEYPIDISVQGGYHNVGIFLEHISKMERVVNVGDMRLASTIGPAGGGAPSLPQGVKAKAGSTLTADFRVTTYTYSAEKDKAAKKEEKKPAAPSPEKKS